MNDSHEDEPTFSLNDFKKWMSKQNDDQKPTKPDLVGIQVESKISIKRLMTKMANVEGDLKEIATEFKEYGGIIIEADQDHHNIKIQVDSGIFTLPKYFTRKIKNDEA